MKYGHWHESRFRERGRRPRKRWRDRCDCNAGPCDGCDVCNFPLLSLVRLSSVLVVVAALLPNTGGTAAAGWGIAGYRRWLTRFTATCPSTPSCSAYAAQAVRTLGARHGLRAVARHVARCGTAPDPAPGTM